ncbi:MAG: radical SAM protein, partial [Lachnospiraceae bacterium]|nr:radical SAM protein [Lachnospiraceae bacterium]
DEKNSITPLKNRDAIALLMSQAYTSKDPNVFARIMDMEAKLIETLDFYLLKCNMEPEAAKMAWEEIIGPRDAFEYIDTLKSHGRHRNSGYGKVMGFLEKKARKLNIPMFGQFELTPLCNLNCKMCYVHLHPDQMSGASPLPAETWKDLIKQAFDKGMLEATLTGGECLTYPGFEEIFLYLHSLGIPVTVMTNGVLLDEKRMVFFKDHPPAAFQITLYGSSEDAYERVTGSRVFARVMENLNRIKEHGFYLSISITPNPFLGDDVFETVRIARSLTQHIVINSSLYAPKGEEWRLAGCRKFDAEQYARIIKYDNSLIGIDCKECPENSLPKPGGPKHVCEEKGLLCGGGRSSFVINWKGELGICNELEVRSHPLDIGFEKAWNEINAAANSWPRTPECTDCPYENVCDSCAAVHNEFAPPGQQPLEFCSMTRFLVSRGILAPPKC